MVGRSHKGAGFLFLLLLTCGSIGSFVGYILSPYLPVFLTKSFSVGAGPILLDLKFLSVTFGFALNMNLFAILGLIIALIVYSRNF